MEHPTLKNNPELKKKLRFWGPVLLILGGLSITIAVIDFFIAFNGMHMPTLGFLFFLAMPFIMAGAIMSNFGYIGSVARYTASEIAPVAKDVTNYMIDGTKDQIIDLTSGIMGRAQPQAAQTKKACYRCGEVANPGAKFCDRCGVALSKVCPKCASDNDGDAGFCQQCGTRL
jgi:ribosomal protein L40E